MVGPQRTRRSVLKLGGGLVAAGVVARPRFVLGRSTPRAATPDAGGGGGGKLTIYSGQHEDLSIAFAEGFEAASGTTLDIRTGSDADLANQIIEEGDQSNADVFITEDPGPAASLDAQGLLTPVDSATLAKTDDRFNPESGQWLAYGGRSRAIFYNLDLIAQNELPASVFDLVNAEWKGKYAYAPSGAFTSTTTYLINTIGEDKTLVWLQGIQATGQNLLKNGAIRDAVEAGQVAFGLSNHYYWYVLAKEKGGSDKLKSQVHFVKGQDPGGLIFASAAAILSSSSNQDLAQQFLSWLADPAGGQAVLATVSPQYPLAPGVESSYGLPPLSELDPPIFDQGTLKDNAKATELILEAGMI